MDDFLREKSSYLGIYKKLLTSKKTIKPKCISYGENGSQYFLYYEPDKLSSEKVIIWIHGGGWNTGSPKLFDFVGQAIAKEGYRFISIGYRLSPIFKYPTQIEDVCNAYNAALNYLNDHDIESDKLIITGSSAGAHLGSILVYNNKIQKEMGVDISKVIGFAGIGGPYSFSANTILPVEIMLEQLFAKNYDRTLGEPCSLMDKSEIPALLIQSRHDGLVDFSCAENFYEKAMDLGNNCELYEVIDVKNTHSWYTVGMFLENREENKAFDKLLTWIFGL